MWGGRRQEAVSERAKWSEADSPGRGRGAPTASIRQGRVTSVGTANERQQQPPPGPQPERRRRSGPSQAPSGTSRCLEIPCGCKDDTPGEQIQHLTLKKKKNPKQKFLYQIRLHQRRPAVTLKQGPPGNTQKCLLRVIYSCRNYLFFYFLSFRTGTCLVPYVGEFEIYHWHLRE